MIVPPGIANGLQTWLQQTRLLVLHLHDELRVHVDLAAMGSKDDSFIYYLSYIMDLWPTEVVAVYCVKLKLHIMDRHLHTPPHSPSPSGAFRVRL